MAEPKASSSEHAFLAGGGEAARRIAALDWSATALGPIDIWPASLRIVLGVVLNSGFPSFLAWGPGLLSFYNDAYCPFLAGKPEALGRPFPEVWPEIWPAVGPIAHASMSGQASFHENLSLVMDRGKGPEPSWWTFSYSPVRDENGAVGGVLCNVHETTATVVAQERLRFLVSLADALRSATSAQGIALVAAGAIGQYLRAGRAGYGEIDPSGEIVSVTHDWTAGAMASLAGQARILDAFGPAIIAELRSGHTLVIEDCRTDPRTADPRYLPTWDSIGTRSLIVVPLLRDRHLGAILYVHAEAPRRWTDVEVTLVEDVALRTWSAYAHAQAEEALRSQEQQLQAAINAADLGTWEVDLVSGASARSLRHDQMFGYTERQAKWSPDMLRRHVVEADLPVVEAGLETGLRTGVIQYEARVRQPDGSIRWIAPLGRAILDDAGRAIRMVGVVQDVTERKEAEQAIQASEERFRMLVDSIDDVFYVTDLDRNQLLYLSPAYERIWGRPAAAVEADLGRFLETVHPDDRDLLVRCKPQQVAGEPTSLDYRIIRPDGEVRWIHDRSFPVHDASGGRRAAGLATDVTERRAAERRLRESEGRLRRAHEAGGIGDWSWDIATNGLTLSDQFPRMLGLQAQHLPRTLAAFMALIVPADQARVAAELAPLLAGEAQRLETEFRVVHPDGQQRWLVCTAQSEGRLADGRPKRIVGVGHDITQRHQAQAALRESEERLRLGLAAGQMATWEYDLASGTVARSPNAVELLGHGTTVGDFRSRMPAGDREADRARLDAALASESAHYESEFRYRHPSGRWMWLQVQGSVVRDDLGRPCRIYGVCVDITARKEAELALQELNATLEAQVELRTRERDRVWQASRDLMCVARPDGILQNVNPAWSRMLGWHEDELIGRHAAAFRHPDDAGRLMEDLARLTSGGDETTCEARYLHRDGSSRWISWSCEQLDGRIYCVGRDVTEEKMRAFALAESERRFRAIFDTALQFMALLDLDGTVLEVNRTAMQWSRIEPGDIVDRPFWLAPPMRDNLQLQMAIRRSIQRAAAGEVVREQHEMRGAGDVVATVDFSLKPVPDEHGRPVGLVAEGRDITDLKNAQEQLRQAQKMEAVGQLTGGIAHDFNNLLHAIQGSLELIRRKPDDTERVARWAENALKVSERGAKLTGRLLTFSRSQRLQLKPVAAGELIAGLGDLLPHTLGRMIQVDLDLDALDVVVLADPTQLEMAVLNLAINARDAMQGGGRLRIGTRLRHIEQDPALAAGDYLEITVADNGTGMSADVASRAFDPFFTTKGVGKGTGLGLSQVYAFALQAGGTVRLASVPGHGTTVTIFLRRADDATVASGGEVAKEVAPPPGRRARIMIVDDDEDVRRILAETLTALGYRVDEAKDGADALDLLKSVGPDLLILDFAMPGMNGADVARAARSLRPDLPIVFATGYAETAAIDAVAGASQLMLRKPFGLHELEAVVMAALDLTTGQQVTGGPSDDAPAS
ncbi:MAG TPA: PAS domain S-box protein [Geminicoccus sp.]|uniref:PAS domain S-box protein n=1 Tax=Geminicoccus sp. TaxID=2024832 RepID=UPI002E334DFF|nr:PAS domain S-box protein [Geminicoccus sp.]HEX2529695.1 PAS domain S-box protein [Geminicoccus sp.]